jgi:hemolysin D
MNDNNLSLSKIKSTSSLRDTVRVLIVDDQHFARQFLTKVLDNDTEVSHLKVVGTANNGREALEKVESLHPDVALVDLEMPEMDGIGTTQIITEKYPDCKVLILSSYDRSDYLQNVLQAGAKGYLLKNTPGEEIRNAISSVSKGYYQIGPELLTKAFDNTLTISTTSTTSTVDITEAATTTSIQTQTTPSEIEPQERWSSSTQELLNTLPRVWSRGFVYLLIVLISIGLPWTFFAKIDETGTARGKIEPKAKTLEINAAVSGKVTKILAKEGQVVNKGQKLLKIESQTVVSQLEQQREKLAGQKNQLAQLKSLKNKHLQTLDSQQQRNQSQTIEKQAQLEQAQKNVKSSGGMYASQQNEKKAQLEQAKEAIKTSQAADELAKIRVTSTAEKIPRYRQAYQNGAISQDRLMEAIQLAKEAKTEVEKAKFELEQAQSSLRGVKSSYQTLVREQALKTEQAKLRLSEEQGSYTSLQHTNNLALLETEERLQNTEAQIASLQGEIAQTDNQVKSLEFQLTQYTIKAPVAGTIFEFPVQNAEATLESGEIVAMIAQVKNNLYPESDLVLRARMPSSKTAFLETGLPAKIKLDAYPFQDYGIVKGHVSWISPDSKVTENPQSGQADEQGEFFELDITVDQAYLATASEKINITPGQTATAEIVVRQRRLIDYFLEPFKKLKKGGVDF